MERHVDNRLKDLSKKADELHGSANLRAMSADCYYHSVVIDIVMSLSQRDPKDTHETAIAVRSHIRAMSEHMLRTATQGAELTQKQPDQWAFFYLYQGSALARLGNFDLALGRCKEVITRDGVTVRTKARAFYNAACYQAAGKLTETAAILTNLQHAVYLNVDYKSKARSDLQLASLWDDVQFVELIR
jgi:hypothetical protein